MRNPYEVLGVASNASDMEINEAYKRLARMYHPDNFNGGVEAEEAKRKMQEINEAYDTIINIRSNSQGSYSSYSDLSDVRRRINDGRLDDAQTILDGIPASQRNAEWHYLKGTIQHRRGWFNEAAVNFEDACRMEPSNREYRQAYENTKQAQRGGYRETRSRNSNSGGCSGCDVCSGLLCADCCCECMGGDLIRCC